MDDQQRARELLATEYEKKGQPFLANDIRAGLNFNSYWGEQVMAAITAALRAAPEVIPSPDTTLLRFYGVSTYPELVSALEEHVLKLIDLRKRNVKPWEDTMPPTLLPRHEREQSPVFAKDLLALADRWQDAAAETWGEGPVNSTKQACCDELREVVERALAARQQGVKDGN